MLYDKFSNRGTNYIMYLIFNAEDNKYNVIIRSDKYHTAKSSYNEYSETHEFETYPEARSKFRSVFIWNHGKRPVLPTEYDFLHDTRVVPETRKDADALFKGPAKEAYL